MTAAKPSKAKAPTAFKQFTDQEGEALRKLGQVTNLEPGAALEAGAELFLVLSGSVRLMRSAHGASLHTATLKAGDWGAQHPSIGTKAVAKGASVVMCFAQIGALPLTVQTKAFQRISHMAERQAQFWAERAVGLHEKTRYLSTYVREARQQAHEQSLHSDVVQGVLRRVPRLPLYVTELLGLLQSPDVEAEAVVECARQDPSLVAELLKLVNSAAFGFDKKIADVHHAVMLLGFNKVAQIVIGMGVAQTMPNTEDFKEVLNRSIALSHMAFEIAKLGHVDRPAMVSTVALLGDVGKSLLMLLKNSARNMDVFLGLLDPARIGALLLRHWNIPQELWQAVELQRLPEFAPPAEIPEALRKTVVVTYLARLCDAYLAGEDESKIEVGFYSDHVRQLSLPETTISGLVNKHIVRTLRKSGGSRIFSA